MGEPSGQQHHQDQPAIAQPDHAQQPAKQAGGGVGVQALQALLRTGGAQPPIDRVVLLVREHAAERDAMLALLHQSVGNAYVAQVMKESAPGALPEAAMKADVLDEHLAHDLAYKNADQLDAKDLAYLAANGLQVGKVFHGQGGLEMTTFIPTAGSKATPVLAFRGTQGGADLVADASAGGIGAYQMAANEGVIAQAIASLAAYGPPTVTGHSLGGALAQMAATRFPGQVGRVVTFQSPGIPKDMVGKLDAHNADAEAHGQAAVMSTHYTEKDDFVTLGGEAFTSGFTVTIARGWALANDGLGAIGSRLDGHASRPLGEYVEGTGAGQRETATASVVDTKDRFPQHTQTFRHLAEAMRVAAGKAIEALQKHGLATGTPTQPYVQTWQVIRGAIDRGDSPAQLIALVEASHVRAAEKQLMIENLREIIASKPATATPAPAP